MSQRPRQPRTARSLAALQHPFPRLQGLSVHLEPIIFSQHTEPNGRLARAIEDQALWYYYLLAYKALVSHRNVIVYEGDKDPLWDIAKIYLSVCKLYGVDPNTLTNRWPRIEAEIAHYNEQMQLTAAAQGRSYVPMVTLSAQYKYPERFAGKPLEGMQ